MEGIRGEESISSLCRRYDIAEATYYKWNKGRGLAVSMALEYPERSPRELAVMMTDEMKIFISESSVYRILKQRGLIRPAEHHFIAAADEFYRKTIVPNEMWQTDFTYFKVLGWVWYYLSTVIDDYSRYIIH